jgi:hypothetical protein
MNANELHKELSSLFHSLKSSEIKPGVACEMINAVGMIVRIAQLQVKFMEISPGKNSHAGLVKFLE